MPMASVSGSTEPLARAIGPHGDPLAVTRRNSPGPRLAPRLARATLIVVLIGFFGVGLIRIAFGSDSAWQLVLGVLYMIPLFWLQVFYFGRTTGPPPRGRLVYAALAAQVVLVYLPLLQFQQGWAGLPGFLAGSLLLALPHRVAWVGVAAVVASMTVAQAAFTDGVIDIVYTGVSTLNVGLIVYGLSRLSTLVVELHQARTDLARMAVAEERLRFARDLHDLLGYSLSAITLKSELTHRLVVTQPAKAQEELSEVLDISRRALSDVRSVASGYRELSLDAEAASARSVLTDAEVEVRMELDYGELPTQVRTVLATVLREGITNVLRHSKAEHCDVVIRQHGGRVQMDIVNDGVQPPRPDAAARQGNGIQNLRIRVAGLGGQFRAGVDPDGRFRLFAAVPLPRSAAPAPAASGETG
jgi:two-component system, NarL family, sensor histidine kinase DesK